MKQFQSFAAWVIVQLIIVGNPALAGIADTPLPVLVPGEKTYHLYSVPGIMGNGGLHAYFSCTSTDTAAMEVGVELFGALGGSPSNGGQLTVAPGATVIIATINPAWLTADLVVGSPGSRYSARILATSKKLACNAFIADALNTPPTSMNHLNIIKKTTQKAAN